MTTQHIDTKMSNVLRAKLVLIGEATVGKTSVVQQFINTGAGFPKNYSMTLGGDVLSRTINIPDTTDAVELVMIDCSGRTAYNDLLARLWDGCSLVVAVYDVTREESLASARTWLEQVKQSTGLKSLTGVLLGNKTDLTERRQVPAKLGLDTATQLSLQYFECSAKENTGVEEPFYYLANEYHKQFSEQANTLAHIAA